MAGDLDMNQHKLINILAPTSSLEAANKCYFDDAISESAAPRNHISPFKYLTDNVDESTVESKINVVGIGTPLLTCPTLQIKTRTSSFQKQGFQMFKVHK